MNKPCKSKTIKIIVAWNCWGPSPWSVLLVDGPPTATSPTGPTCPSDSRIDPRWLSWAPTRSTSHDWWSPPGSWENNVPETHRVCMLRVSALVDLLDGHRHFSASSSACSSDVFPRVSRSFWTTLRQSWQTLGSWLVVPPAAAAFAAAVGYVPAVVVAAAGSPQVLSINPTRKNIVAKWGQQRWPAHGKQDVPLLMVEKSVGHQ